MRICFASGVTEHTASQLDEHRCGTPARGLFFRQTSSQGIMYSTLWPTQLSCGLHGRPSGTCPCSGRSAASHTRNIVQGPDLVVVSGAVASPDNNQTAQLQAAQCSREHEQLGSRPSSWSRRAALAGISSCVGLMLPGTLQAAVPEIIPAQSAGLAERLTRALPFPFPMVTPEPVRFPR